MSHDSSRVRVVPDRMTDHWWWRPGVRPGRRVLVWHILPDDQPAVRALVRAYQERLAGIAGLDPVPARWLHLTTQVVGFADEIPDARAGRLVRAVRARLRRLVPVTVELGAPLGHSEAVVLGTRPAGALDPLRREIRAAVAESMPGHRLGDGPEWTPHLAAAYSNRAAPGAPIAAALRPPPAPRPLRVRAVRLVRQWRTGRLYEWEEVAAVPIGPAARTSVRTD